ncbi:hypothetical protein [Microbacterium sp. CJ77]|uniref:hypothetical protein n=1 Tax=Microbacterium sp. CJ77 TaxID=2079201 RepID=UPI000CD8E74D|nr:hypothetical protein [Microbacterium sp. CJ77]
MADRSSLKGWVLDALRELGGEGKIVEVCKVVWRDHGDELTPSGDLFYTWQYDIRWAAQHLRDNGYLVSVQKRRDAPWVLSELGRKTDTDAAAEAVARR